MLLGDGILREDGVVINSYILFKVFPTGFR